MLLFLTIGNPQTSEEQKTNYESRQNNPEFRETATKKFARVLCFENTTFQCKSSTFSDCHLLNFTNYGKPTFGEKSQPNMISLSPENSCEKFRESFVLREQNMSIRDQH